VSAAVDPHARLSPYKGLQPFDEGDAAYFFGRAAEARLIVANLFAAPLTLLYGPTGVGKSSLLQAGVMPQLHARDHVVAATFRSWQATRDPLASIRAALADAAPEAVDARDASLAAFVEASVAQLGRRVMLILDQFEEYFLAPADESFDRELVTAVNRRDLPVSVVLSIREDALAALDRYQGSMPSLFQNYLRVDHLDRADAEDAIRRPLDVFNAEHGTDVRVDDALVAAALDELEPGRLELDRPWQPAPERRRGLIEAPYLQLVLERLWDEERSAGSSVLRAETLRRVGGADHIVRTYLDERLAALPRREQDVAARIFRYLVTPSGTKIALRESDLAEWASVPPAALAPTLERLARDGWLLRRVTPQASGGAPRYEIVHDYLAPAVLRWRDTYLRARGRRRRRRVLIAAAAAVLALAGAGFAVLVSRLGAERDKVAKAQANLSRVVPNVGVLRLRTPFMRGTDVQAAQSLLSGNNVYRTAFYPRGLLDGIFGPATASASDRARYWLGYPDELVSPTFDDTLRAFLVGDKELPAAYLSRRAARLRAAGVRPRLSTTTVGGVAPNPTTVTTVPTATTTDTTATTDTTTTTESTTSTETLPLTTG
jgi:hypothetical protein